MRKWIITNSNGIKQWTPDGWHYSRLMTFLYKIKALKKETYMLPKGAT